VKPNFTVTHNFLAKQSDWLIVQISWLTICA
jgi:hypothetical protein